MNININVQIEGMDQLIAALQGMTLPMPNVAETVIDESPNVAISIDEFKSLLMGLIDSKKGDDAKKMMQTYGAERISDLSDADRIECAVALRQLAAGGGDE